MHFVGRETPTGRRGSVTASERRRVVRRAHIGLHIASYRYIPITYQIITRSLCHHVIIILSLTYTRCITYHHTATPCLRCAHSILYTNSQ